MVRSFNREHVSDKWRVEIIRLGKQSFKGNNVDWDKSIWPSFSLVACWASWQHVGQGISNYISMLQKIQLVVDRRKHAKLKLKNRNCEEWKYVFISSKICETYQKD